jgi:hypothetical protein
MKRLMFEVAPGDTADPDQPVSWGSARKEDHMSIKEHVYGSTKEHVYGEVDSAGDLKRIFAQIRSEVAMAPSRDELTDLYRRAGYLVTLTYSPAWKKKFGEKVAELREIAEQEFSRTAHKINERARTIGTDPDYDEKWGDG